MKIITRYLAREVYSVMLVVIMVLLTVFLSNQFVRYLHHFAVAGTLPGQGIKILLLLQLPILSAVLLPASLFLAILLSYGRLYADNEMTILVTCGISPMQLLKITFGFSTVVMFIVAILSLWINPMIYNYSDRILSGSVSTTALETVKPNSFTSVARDKLVFYIDKSSHNKKDFSHVFVSEQFDSGGQIDDKKHSVIMAKNAYQKIDKNTGDLYVVLNDGYRYVGTPGKKDYEVIKYDNYVVRIQQDVGTWQADISSASTLKLWLDRGDKTSTAELQWRISLPLSALILTLVGTPLSKIKPRYGRYAKIIPAILLYIIYANFLFLAKAWLKNGVISPLIGMWWVHGLMLLIAMFLIGSQNGFFAKIKNKYF